MAYKIDIIGEMGKAQVVETEGDLTEALLDLLADGAVVQVEGVVDPAAPDEDPSVPPSPVTDEAAEEVEPTDDLDADDADADGDDDSDSEDGEDTDGL